MAMNIELKPCPFCGGEAEMMGDQYPYVECHECGAGFTANHSYEFDEDDAANNWNSRRFGQDKMKRIAEKKIEQLGGDVCGVLVRKDGKLAAVDEHGRVQWLQSGQGVEPVAWWNGFGLLTRHEELPVNHRWAKIIPLYTHPQPAQQVSVPEPVAWGSKPSEPGRYVVRGFDSAGTEALVCVAEADGELVCNLHDSNSDPLEGYSNLMSEISDRFEWVELHTHPQPAQQGSVPEEWGYVVEVFLENVEEVTELLLSGGAADNIVALCNDLNKAATVAEKVLSTPQPEGDGWIKCGERLPTEADGDWDGQVIVLDDYGDMACTNWSVATRSIITHWKPTGLKRPQPPQEGSGDE